MDRADRIGLRSVGLPERQLLVFYGSPHRSPKLVLLYHHFSVSAIHHLFQQSNKCKRLNTIGYKPVAFLCPTLGVQIGAQNCMKNRRKIP